jgi:hypothetical protein
MMALRISTAVRALRNAAQRHNPAESSDLGLGSGCDFATPRQSRRLGERLVVFRVRHGIGHDARAAWKWMDAPLQTAVRIRMFNWLRD